MTAEVVDLRSSPALTDIPSQLRQMADAIESGDVEAQATIFVIPKANDWPDVFGWGEHLTDHNMIAILEMAKTWFVNNLSQRIA